MCIRDREKYNLQLQEEIDLLKVKLNSEHMAEGAVVLMAGWIPEDCEADVRKLLQRAVIRFAEFFQSGMCLHKGLFRIGFLPAQFGAVSYTHLCSTCRNSRPAAASLYSGEQSVRWSS